METETNPYRPSKQTSVSTHVEKLNRFSIKLKFIAGLIMLTCFSCSVISTVWAMAKAFKDFARNNEVEPVGMAVSINLSLNYGFFILPIFLIAAAIWLACKIAIKINQAKRAEG